MSVTFSRRSNFQYQPPAAAISSLLLGDHGKDFDLDTQGTSPSSVTLNTQTSGSTILVLRGCEFANTNAPTDNKSNTYTQVGSNQGYAGGLWPGFGIQIWAKAGATGGSSHTVQFTKSGSSGEESSLIVAEIKDAGSIHTSGFVARASSGAGATHASASITTSVPCRLISLWSGDGVTGTPDFTANPSAGWTSFEFDFRPTGTAYIQMAAAVRDVVVPAGTYSMNWIPVSDQGSSIGLVAVAA